MISIGTRYSAERERARNVIGRRIAELRAAGHMSQAELSRALADFGVHVGNTAVNKWELGGSVPNAYQLLAVAQALGVEDVADAFMSAEARSLNAEGLRKLRDYRDDLIASGRYRRLSEETVACVEMPVSWLPASAGTGAFLDGDGFELLSVPETSVPAGAEFGVRVSGDSMEPVYQDGQIVWVQPCKTLRCGEVGIFVYGGEGYIKLYGTQEPEGDAREALTDSSGTVHPQPVLISYNRHYEPKAVRPELGFEIVGRVLS